MNWKKYLLNIEKIPEPVVFQEKPIECAIIQEKAPEPQAKPVGKLKGFVKKVMLDTKVKNIVTSIIAAEPSVTVKDADTPSHQIVEVLVPVVEEPAPIVEEPPLVVEEPVTQLDAEEPPPVVEEPAAQPVVEEPASVIVDESQLPPVEEQLNQPIEEIKSE